MKILNKKSFLNKRAFTLIELLIVIAIIGILFIVLVSKVDFATDKAKASGVQTDFRSFQMAFDTVAKENAGFNTFGWDTGDANQNGKRDSYDEGDNGAGGGTAKNGIQDGDEVFTGHKVYDETFTKVFSLKKNGTGSYDREALNRLETAINANLDPKLHITIKDDGEIVMANGARDPWNKEYHGWYITNAEVDGKDRGAIIMYSDGANNEFGSAHNIAGGKVSVTIPNSNKNGKDDYSLVSVYSYINGYGELLNSTTGFSNNQMLFNGNSNGVDIIPDVGPTTIELTPDESYYGCFNSGEMIKCEESFDSLFLEDVNGQSFYNTYIVYRYSLENANPGSTITIDNSTLGGSFAMSSSDNYLSINTAWCLLFTNDEREVVLNWEDVVVTPASRPTDARLQPSSYIVTLPTDVYCAYMYVSCYTDSGVPTITVDNTGTSKTQASIKPPAKDYSDNMYIETREPGLHKPDGSFVSWDELIANNIIAVDDGKLYGVCENNPWDLNNYSQSYLEGELVVSDKAGVVCIPQYGFFGFNKLTGIVLPETVTTIEDTSFMDCSSISSIVLSGNITSIGSYAFYTSNLKTLVFNGTMAQWNSMERDLYWNGGLSVENIKCLNGTIASN